MRNYRVTYWYDAELCSVGYGIVNDRPMYLSQIPTDYGDTMQMKADVRGKKMIRQLKSEDRKNKKKSWTEADGQQSAIGQKAGMK